MGKMNRNFTSKTSTAENDGLYNCIKKNYLDSIYGITGKLYYPTFLFWPIFEGDNPKMHYNNLCEKKA